VITDLGTDKEVGENQNKKGEHLRDEEVRTSRKWWLKVQRKKGGEKQRRR